MNNAPETAFRGRPNSCNRLSGLILVVIALIASISLSWHARADEETPDEANSVIVLAIAYPPLIGAELDGFGPMFGLMKSYASEHFQVMIHPRFVPPARAQKQVYDGDWCLTTYPPHERQADAVFVPLMNGLIRLGLLRRRLPTHTGPFIWQSLEDLRGSSITMLRSNIESVIHHRIMDAGIDIVEVETMQQGIDLLLKGRVDYAQGDNLSYTMFDEETRKQLDMSESYLFQTRVGFYYNSNCADRLFRAGHTPPKEAPNTELYTR